MIGQLVKSRWEKRGGDKNVDTLNWVTIIAIGSHQFGCGSSSEWFLAFFCLSFCLSGNRSCSISEFFKLWGTPPQRGAGELKGGVEEKMWGKDTVWYERLFCSLRGRPASITLGWSFQVKRIVQSMFSVTDNILLKRRYTWTSIKDKEVKHSVTLYTILS